MAWNYDIANRAAIVQRCSRAHVKARPATALRLRLPPSAEDDTAECHAEQGPAHVDTNKRPRIGFERGEHRNGRVFHKHKGEPACERDFQATPDACWVGPRNKNCEGVIDSDRTKEREHVGADVMRVFDVSHRARMKIQPFLAKNCVPAPTDQKIHNDQDPDGEMIDLRVHSSLGIIFPLGLQLQVDSSNGQSFSSVGQLSVRVIGIGSGCSAQVTSPLQGEGEGEARTPDEEA